ncbi:MAG TPA: Coenzyme F420 hydrogenase/dehydrogenase, beta subunit C-terminal domain [Pseudobacteroides sp.]|uniref:Coenzyme F420 hydrogenase/dehydrogenase, beta subunit C-terminal domain n=1 Tax=Pseudobacteroides sp. TaxID=1968840 RepID=UPI002F94655B
MNIREVGTACVGCRGCEQICPCNCIDINENHEGFLYPVIRENACVNCGLCVKHCPAMNPSKFQSEAPVAVYALKNKDEKRILDSASGGASDLIAHWAIKMSGVVFGCTYTKDMQVEHTSVDKYEELQRIQSSKYVQSNLKNCYSIAKKFIDEGKVVLFTGTPCQIAGLYSYLGKREHGNLYTIDLICHGVPSPHFLLKYFKFLEKKLNEPVLEYNFRSKEKRGWGTHYLLRTATRTKSQALSLDRYGKHFMDGDCYRECCYQCKYATTRRVGDITIGDFWGIQKCHPEFASKFGVSSVLANNEKGKLMINSIRENAEIIECSLDEVMMKQGNLIRPTIRPDGRDLFYKNITNEDFIEKIKIGLNIKERVKSVIPKSIIDYLKRRL